MKAVSHHQRKPNHLLLFAAVAFIFTLFLFFIDEGNYSLSGLTDTGNLIALSLYFVAMLLGQTLTHLVLQRLSSEALALRLSIIIGSLGGVIVMAIIFFFWMK